MSNTAHVKPPYLENLRDLITHARNLAEREVWDRDEMTPEVLTSTRLYERDALENFIGEVGCVIQEARKRIRYLESILAEDI